MLRNGGVWTSARPRAMTVAVMPSIRSVLSFLDGLRRPVSRLRSFGFCFAVSLRAHPCLECGRRSRQRFTAQAREAEGRSQDIRSAPGMPRTPFHRALATWFARSRSRTASPYRRRPFRRFGIGSSFRADEWLGAAYPWIAWRFRLNQPWKSMKAQAYSTRMSELLSVSAVCLNRTS